MVQRLSASKGKAGRERSRRAEAAKSIVIASAAKQTRSDNTLKVMDCFVARAPRNDTFFCGVTAAFVLVSRRP